MVGCGIAEEGSDNPNGTVSFSLVFSSRASAQQFITMFGSAVKNDSKGLEGLEILRAIYSGSVLHENADGRLAMDNTTAVSPFSPVEREYIYGFEDPEKANTSTMITNTDSIQFSIQPIENGDSLWFGDVEKKAHAAVNTYVNNYLTSWIGENKIKALSEDSQFIVFYQSIYSYINERVQRAINLNKQPEDKIVYTFQSIFQRSEYKNIAAISDDGVGGIYKLALSIVKKYTNGNDAFMYHVQARLLEQMVTVAYEGLLTNLKDIVGSQGKNIPNVMSERDVIVSLEKIFRGIIDEEVRGYKGGIFNNPIQKAESALKEWDSVNGPSGNDDSGGGTPLGGAGTDGGAKPDSGQAVKKIAIDETSAQLAVAKKTQEENPAFNRGMIAIGEVAQALQKENDEMREPFTRGMIAIAQVAQLQQTQQEQNTFFNRGIAAISEVAQLQNKQEGAAFNRGMAVIATVARKQQKLNVKEAAAFNRGMAAIGEVAKRQEDATTYQALIARGMTVLAEIIKAQQLQDAQEAAAFNRGMDIISQAASLQSDVEIKAVINRGFAAISEVARFQQDKEAALERVRLTISQELESVIEKNAQFILSDQSGAIFRKFITVIMQTAIKKESEENAKEFF